MMPIAQPPVDPPALPASAPPIAEATRAGDCVYLLVTLPTPATAAASAASGDNVRVALGAAAAAPRAIAVPAAAAAAVRRIAIEDGALVIGFATSRAYRVEPGPDGRTIAIDIGATCGGGSGVIAAPAAGEGTRAADPARLARLEADAEAAIRTGDTPRAAALLEEMLGYVRNPHTPRVRELLGLLRERVGRTEEARAIYRDYLDRFPGTEGAARVTQRLAALGRPTASPVLRDGSPPDQDKWKADIRGVVAQFYLRDRSNSTFINTRLTPSVETVDHRINVDEVLSTADVTASVARGSTHVEVRASAGHVSELRPVILVGANRNEGSYDLLSALYLDVADDRLGASVRVGRQTRFGQGVFGRFDGVAAGIDVAPRTRINAVVGHPVWSARQTDIDASRTFYGGSIDHGAKGGSLWGSLYWFDQRASGLVDRQAIGAEFRVSKTRLALYGVVDYDVSFGRLNAAYLNASRPFADGSNLALTASYFRYPILATSNAVFAQPVPSLDILRDTFDLATLRAIALDRTMSFRGFTATYTRPLGRKWQAIVDATVSRTSGAPASFGVPAFAAAGTEWYLGAQLIGSGIALPGDSWLIGLRFADAQLGRYYIADLNVLTPVTRDVSIAPRLRVAWRDQRGTGRQAAVTPALRLVWRLTRDTELEAEAGGNFLWQHYEGPTLFGRRHESAMIGHIGYRIRF